MKTTSRSKNASKNRASSDAATSPVTSPDAVPSTLGVDVLPEMVLPDLDSLSLKDLHVDDEQDSRAFYKWLDAHWGGEDRPDDDPSTRFLLDELDERGGRIQKMGQEIEQLRERVLEREVQIVRLESDLAERQRSLSDLSRDIEAQGERYRKALQSSSESRRATRELELETERLRQQDVQHAQAVGSLHAQMERLMAQVVELENALPPAPSVDEEMAERLRVVEAKLAEVDARRNADGDRYRELFGEKDALVVSLQAQLADREAELARVQAELSTWPLPQARRLRRMIYGE